MTREAEQQLCLHVLLAMSRFLLSGADVITTATYQASIRGFIDHLRLSPDGARELLMSGVHLARETADSFQSGNKLTAFKARAEMLEESRDSLPVCFRAERSGCGGLSGTIRGLSSRRLRVHWSLRTGDECRSEALQTLLT